MEDILREVEKALEGVPAKSYYRIGEVARITAIKAYVLRYWETEFRAVGPPRSKSGQRMYRRREIQAILLVKKLLYKQRFTIAGARRRLTELLREGRSEAAAPPPAPVADLAALGPLRRELQSIRALLAPA